MINLSIPICGSDIGADLTTSDLIVVDEAHHAPSESFSELLETLEPEFLLGLTATPWRGDKRNLRELFGDPKFSMTVVEGMQKGFLSEVEYKMYTDDINWDEIRDLSEHGYTIKDLNRRLLMPERDIKIIDTIHSEQSHIKDPRILIFCVSIEHAERMKRLLMQYDLISGIIHSRLKRHERFKALSDFKNGKIKILISIEILNEGIDVPEVNMIVFAKVTHSRRIFLQQLGRGLRISPQKDRVLVLDFVADVRRIGAALELNNEARIRAQETEVLKFKDGRIVNFDSENEDFFNEYLSDISSISDLDEDAKLKFPD